MPDPAPNPSPQPEESPETPETPSSQQPPKVETEEGEFETPDFSELVGIADGSVEAEPPETPPEVTPPKVEETPPETPGEEEPPKGADEPPPETPPAEEPPAETPPKDEPETPPTAEEEPPPEVKVPTKEELEGMYETFRKETMPALESLYQLDEETASAFDENPKEVLPKIAAQLHFEAMMSSYNAVMAAVPAVVGRYIKAAEQATLAQNAFFDSWPQLKGQKETVIRTAIQSYRQANPTATTEESIKGAGTLAASMLGVSLEKPKEEPPPKPKTDPPKPAAPAGGSPTPPPKPKAGEEENVFADISELFDQQ